MTRLQLIPDESIQPLAQRLRTRLEAIASELNWEHLIDLFGAEGTFLTGLVRNHDERREIQLWGKSPTHFVIVWTSKGVSDSCIGTVTAELGHGLVNQVFESRRPEVKVGGFLNCPDWTNLENRRGLKIAQMAAHPLVIFGRCLAVLTVSHFGSEDAAEGPDESEVKVAHAAASLLTRLVEDRLIRACLGFAQG